MDKIAIVNNCPTGADREISATGQIVAHGEFVDIDAALAGRPPTGTPGEEGYDPGAGLLAQVDVWRARPAKSVKAKD